MSIYILLDVSTKSDCEPVWRDSEVVKAAKIQHLLVTQQEWPQKVLLNIDAWMAQLFSCSVIIIYNHH